MMNSIQTSSRKEKKMAVIVKEFMAAYRKQIDKGKVYHTIYCLFYDDIIPIEN